MKSADQFDPFVGKRVRLFSGEEIGKCRARHDQGAPPSYEVEWPDGKVTSHPGTALDMSPHYDDPAMPCCGRRESEAHTAECPSALGQDHDLYQFTRRQLATILAALRAWQHDIGTAREHVDADFQAIAADGGEPLNDAEIDELCEVLNFEPARYVEHHDADCEPGCQIDSCMHYEMNPPEEPRRAIPGARG